MRYLIAEIWAYLAGAGVLGAAVVWMLARIRAQAHLESNNAKWQKRLRGEEEGAIAAVRAAQEKSRIEIEGLDATVNALHADLEAQMERASQLYDEVGQWRAKNAELREQHDQTTAKLRLMDERLAAALASADTLDVALKRIQAQPDTGKQGPHELRELARTVADRESRIRELEGLEDLVRELREQSHLIEREHAQVLKEKDEEAHRLRGRITQMEPQVAQAHLLAQEVARLKSRATESDRDDLKRIRGIGPKLERKLNGLGYRTYQQIARWGPEDIGRVEDTLGDFADRIRRDDWIGQARRLQEEVNAQNVSN